MTQWMGSACTDTSSLKARDSGDGCYWFVCFVGDGFEAREARRLAKVTQLDSTYPPESRPSGEDFLSKEVLPRGLGRESSGRREGKPPRCNVRPSSKPWVRRGAPQ